MVLFSLVREKKPGVRLGEKSRKTSEMCWRALFPFDPTEQTYIVDERVFPS